jgi:hypothetical protein
MALEAEETLLIAEAHDIDVVAVHIRGELNVLADMLSRQRLVLKTEWRLGQVAFNWICVSSLWGAPQVDLFANRLNTQLPRYMSPCEDENAEGVDALLCSWPDTVCYAFPPTTILARVITKIQQERPRRLLLVAPWWPTKSWFPFLQMAAVQVTVIPEKLISLEQPHFEHKMMSPELLCLALWQINWSA